MSSHVPWPEGEIDAGLEEFLAEPEGEQLDREAAFALYEWRVRAVEARYIELFVQTYPPSIQEHVRTFLDPWLAAYCAELEGEVRQALESVGGYFWSRGQ